MWIAMTISNIGTWMNEVGVTWLMATMPTSNLTIALIQAAISLPFLLLAYPSGTLADLVDRRWMLLLVNIAMFITAAGLAMFAFYDLLTPHLLLLFTFMLGVGNAIMRPAWAASVPSFAPIEQLPNAVTLNTLSTNITRAIGPAIGGFIIYLSSPTVIFCLNALSFTVLIVVIYNWAPSKPKVSSALPVERFFGAFKSGIRYVRNVPALRFVLVRSFMFFFFASASWALLPIVVIREMDMGSQSYGISMAVIGLGTILGAFLLPKCHRVMSRNSIIILATAILACALLLLATVPNKYTLGITLVALGSAWIFSFSSLILAAQLVVPNWVRARTLSLVMLVFGGSMGVGSLLWGNLSDTYSTSVALGVAAAGLFASLLFSKRFAIANDSVDVSPSTQWPMTIPEDSVDADKGPVMVTIQYQIAEQNIDAFASLMEQMKVIRKRNGAYFWQLFHDANNNCLFSEMYMSESWLEVLRQRQRTTASEFTVRDQVRALHIGSHPPTISIQIAGKG
ncbi:MAG: MFS transporter [Cycloclasticus sp.]|nr:MAG: MFS transporter [Cycloclasticus sp.]